MSSSTSDRGVYPGCDLSLSQLLHAAKRKLQNDTFNGRTVTTVNLDEADSLEQVAFEVLRLVRSAKNSLAPISRIPPEVLSLIPDYNGGYRIDRGLVALTHVCHSWRVTFTSRSSLWTHLDFMNIDKTRTYIQRSQSSPLEVYIGGNAAVDASALVIPHIHRLKSVTIRTEKLPRVLEYFPCHTPLLEQMDIDLCSTASQAPDNAFLNGDFSSLRKLRLCGGITYFPWRGLENLRVVNLRTPYPRYTLTRLLDFLESAPLLHTVELCSPVRGPSDAPPRRIVSLRHLKAFTIEKDPPHSIILDHLHIPVGASLISKFDCYMGREPPPMDYLPERSPNPNYLSHITAINLRFHRGQACVRLSGPSGSLRLFVSFSGLGYVPHTAQGQLFRSFDPIISTTERLAVLGYYPTELDEVKDCPLFQMLSSANHLRILALTNCDNILFIHAIDPEQNPSNFVPCPHLEELVVCTEYLPPLVLEHLINMVKNRASRGAKLTSVRLVNLRSRKQEDEVLKFREHGIRVESRFGSARPAWDSVPGESGSESW